MALFTVVAQLVLSTQDKARFERIAVALEAVAAKVTEPDPTPPPETDQGAVDTLMATLRASNTTLADEVAKILAVNPTPQGA